MLLRVRFSDTDAMGIVHHGRYFDYFEAVRESYLRRRGIDFAPLFEAGYNIPLSGAAIRFQRPVRFGGRILATARLASCSRVRLRFDYELAAEPISPGPPGALLASGWTEHVFTDLELNLRRFPRDFIEKLHAAERPEDSRVNSAEPDTCACE